MGFQTSRQTQCRTQGARHTKRIRGRTPEAEYQEAKELPTRSKNSELTSRNKTCGTHKGTHNTTYPQGVPPLVIKTNHLRSARLFWKYQERRLDCPDTRSNNWRIPVYKCPYGRRQWTKPDISGYNPSHGDKPSMNPPHQNLLSRGSTWSGHPLYGFSPARSYIRLCR